jgi:hypothetical protein
MSYGRMRGLQAQSGAPLGGATVFGSTVRGEAQTGLMDCKVVSSGNTAKVLDPAGTNAVGSTLSLVNGTAAYIQGAVLAFGSAGGVESWTIELVAKQDAGAISLTLNTINVRTANLNGWTVVASTSGTNSIVLTVTGHGAAGTIHWECWLRVTEVRKGV